MVGSDECRSGLPVVSSSKLPHSHGFLSGAVGMRISDSLGFQLLDFKKKIIAINNVLLPSGVLALKCGFLQMMSDNSGQRHICKSPFKASLVVNMSFVSNILGC